MKKIEMQVEYKSFFIQVREQIKSSQAKAALSVNTALIKLYWNIGRMISEMQVEYAWGEDVIGQLSRDLKAEFPDSSGFSTRNLHDTRRFYLFYSSEIMRQAVAKMTLPVTSFQDKDNDNDHVSD